MSYIYIIRDKDLNIEFVSTDRETLELYCRFNNLSEDYIETFKDAVAYKEQLKSALETSKKGYKFFEDEDGNFSCVPYLFKDTEKDYFKKKGKGYSDPGRIEAGIVNEDFDKAVEIFKLNIGEFKKDLEKTSFYLGSLFNPE